MFFHKPKFVTLCSILILVLLSGMSGQPPAESSQDAGPEIRISTPSYPIGMDGKDSQRIPYTFKASGDFSGRVTSRVLQFYTQYDEPLSGVFGPYPTEIHIDPLQASQWKELVYLPESVVTKARALEEYAVVLKTTFFGVSSGGKFHAEASLLLLLPPASFSKIAPANRAADQPLNLSLKWTSTVGAIDYEYCLDPINNNSCDAGWIGSYEAQARLKDLPSGATFYWQVRANNTAGATYANNGTWWSFTTCSKSLITVTNTNDSGAGSLRQAVADLCPGGTIKFAASLSGQTITLASTLSIDKDLTMDGSSLTSKIALDGDHQRRILEILSPAQVIIDQLRFVNGSAPSGGAIYNTGNLTVRNSVLSDNDASNGAAIYNEGSLTVVNSLLSGNSALNQGGAIFNFANASLLVQDSTFMQNAASDGGAIITTLGSETSITGSLFTGNTATSTGGAILLFPGTVNITNSTFFGNQASAGGGIGNSSGTLTVVNSTFSENQAGEGGGIANGGSLHLSNTILANSVGGSDCSNYGSIQTNIANLVETNDCNISVLISSDPNLGSLADNGGPTQTLALLAGSPAIDSGNNKVCPATDQRGAARPQGSHCDIGAYETVGSVEIRIGEAANHSYAMLPGEIRRVSYQGVNQGPVRIANTQDRAMLAAERVIYKVNGINTSFSEIMGLPDSQLDTIYWLPWYNNVDLDTQLRFANVSNATATVQVSIGGQPVPGSPFTLLTGESLRKSFAGINKGPVKIVSDQTIVAAERVIYKVNKTATSFSEIMALPNSQLNTLYWLPWYNNRDLDTQLRLANINNIPISIHVSIGGQEMQGSPFTLGAGESKRLSFSGINSGPVKMESDQLFVASERVIYKVKGTNTSFSEMMALPNSQLDTKYWLPWYNNRDLDTQLRFANIYGAPATVHIYIGGVEMQGSPFTLQANESTRLSFPGINAGPVQIVSDTLIIAAERVIYKAAGNIPTSFSEMMGLPNSQLDAIYWLPWYNNVDLDSQLRFGVP